MSSTSPGSLSAGVRGHNNGTGTYGIGVYGSHAGQGWGVYGTTAGTGSAAIAGYFYNSGSSGLALRANGNVRFSGGTMNAGTGRVLVSTDADGNATWEDGVIYTAWTTLSSAWRDTTVDGSVCKTNHLFLSCLNSTIVDQGSVQGFFKIPGDVINFPLPYTSFAGGKANTIWFQVHANKIQLYRFTHDNSGSVGTSSILQYRFVIIPGKSSCGSNIFMANPAPNNPCYSTVPCENKN